MCVEYTKAWDCPENTQCIGPFVLNTMSDDVGMLTQRALTYYEAIGTRRVLRRAALR